MRKTKQDKDTMPLDAILRRMEAVVAELRALRASLVSREEQPRAQEADRKP